MREGGRKGGREGGREGGSEGGREGEREGVREGGRKGGREGRREGGSEGGRERGRGSISGYPRAGNGLTGLIVHLAIYLPVMGCAQRGLSLRPCLHGHVALGAVFHKNTAGRLGVPVLNKCPELAIYPSVVEVF